MSKIEWKRSISVLGRMLLGYALIFSQCALAGQNQKAKDKAGSPQKDTAQQSGEKQSSVATAVKAQPEGSQGEPSESSVGQERTSRDGSHEGVKVHGHWTIEVRNPDGSVVTHREFENSLGLSGGSSLVAVLSRGVSVGFWKITLSDLNTANPIGPCTNSVNIKGISCDIIEPGWASASGQSVFSFQFPTLTVSSIPYSGTNPAQLVLSGTAVASVSDAIAFVSTLLNVCAATVAPSNPCGTPQSVFTFAALTNNFVNVTAGQTIAVTVTISFS
jgi:hypothetical protein